MIDTKQYWESRAEHYGSRAPYNLGLSDDQLQEEIESLSPFFSEHLEKMDTLLDAGMGCGRFQPLLEQFCDEYYGLDFSKNMLVQTNGNRVQGDLVHVPFKDRKFDQVISIVVIQHILKEDRFEQTIRELMRVTRKRLLIFDAILMGEWTKGLGHIACRPLNSYVRIMLRGGFNVSVYPGGLPHVLIVAERKWHG